MAHTIYGKVTSDKGDKTIVVTVTERKTHPLYKKQYTVNTKFMAHDQKNEAKIGDRVSIVESRPLSARKHFSLAKILERGGVRFEETDATADIPQEELTGEIKETESK
jgi:small subunit ribosomal protein S17